MKKCVIIGNANIERYDISKRYICSGDYIIYCDGGLKHMEGLGATPDLIIGDFDSYDNPNLEVETIVLPCEKDDTDTAYAVKEAIKRGYEEIVMLGVLGQRLDHTLGNVSLLLMLKNAGIHAIAVDDYSERLTVDGEVKFACVDGPEFDGHKVDFDQAMKRQTLYKTAEGRAFLKLTEGDTHHGGCGNCGGDK